MIVLIIKTEYISTHTHMMSAELANAGLRKKEDGDVEANVASDANGSESERPEDTEDRPGVLGHTGN